MNAQEATQKLTEVRQLRLAKIITKIEKQIAKAADREKDAINVKFLNRDAAFLSSYFHKEGFKIFEINSGSYFWSGKKYKQIALYWEEKR